MSDKKEADKEPRKSYFLDPKAKVPPPKTTFTPAPYYFDKKAKVMEPATFSPTTFSSSTFSSVPGNVCPFVKREDFKPNIEEDRRRAEIHRNQYRGNCTIA